MVTWSIQDKTILITIKKNNPDVSWVAISEVLNDQHSPAACRQFYTRQQKSEENSEADSSDSSVTLMASKVKKPSTPLTLSERRKICKLRERIPPVPWRRVADVVGYSVDTCKDFYENHVTEKEILRGQREADLEQDREERITIRKPEKSRQDDVRLSSPPPRTPSSSSGEQEMVTITNPRRQTTTTRKYWTEDEVEELLRLRIKKNMSFEKIANILGRTVGSCQAKYQRL